MLSFFRKKNLNQVLNQTKKVRIHGVLFTLKKINPMDHLTGAKVLAASYAEYTRKPDENMDQSAYNKIKEHLKDVILASVISPKLSRKEGGEGIYIEQLFSDFSLINDLYSEIMLHSYGKKKSLLNI